ncbi:hypothetical protein CHO01_36880 [Cellulomonas hominis]|uniref:Uncharacterized protein n=1 Tax=Cellulomonas hominis TaxID=156981 RepID=A0A511FH99_9CELL|nr:hypothetical protein [Cellulomonas hominis]MBB5474728.1 hypothetical protein [Cellulomonas hominis]NKY05990.1 hypothetical protein [Cellulomonas hominis]GEL48572.1 hypothetical protein CHO01_36880 [Cellulomonas hominis]
MTLTATLQTTQRIEVLGAAMAAEHRGCPVPYVGATRTVWNDKARHALARAGIAIDDTPLTPGQVHALTREIRSKLAGSRRDRHGGHTAWTQWVSEVLTKAGWTLA